MRPQAELGIWFHDLPPPATISGAIVATNAGTAKAGMVMALAYKNAPGE